MLPLSLFINFLFQSSSPLLCPSSMMLLSFSTNAPDKRVPKRTYCETSLERLTPNLFYSQLHGAPKPYSVLFTWLRNLDCAMSITEHVYLLLLFVSILHLGIGQMLVVLSPRLSPRARSIFIDLNGLMLKRMFDDGVLLEITGTTIETIRQWTEAIYSHIHLLQMWHNLNNFLERSKKLFKSIRKS